ncbi:MAG: phosphate ABC transporter permease subunit PstC [Brevinematia bacterium]
MKRDTSFMVTNTFRRKFVDFASRIGVYVVAGLTIILLAFVIIFIFKEAFSLFTKGYVSENANFRNLLSLSWQPINVEPRYGIIPLIMGSLKVALIALVIALPLGVLSALYVSVYASRRVKEVVKPVIELIAGLPTVVIGFFMLIVAASFLQSVLQWDFRLNAVVGGMGVSLVIIPVVFTISEDGMNAVPRSIIESAYAMGASKHHIAWKIVLPSSLNAVFSAGIVGGMRAFGETMIVLMATGNAPIPLWDPLLPVRTMSATIASEMGEVHIGSEHYVVLFIIGFILLVVTLIFNTIANVVASLLRRKLYS